MKYKGTRHDLSLHVSTHSSVLAWRMPWTEEPGGLQSTGSQRVDRTERLNDKSSPRKERQSFALIHFWQAFFQLSVQKFSTVSDYGQPLNDILVYLSSISILIIFHSKICTFLI